MLREMPRRSWNWSKRVTPNIASRTISIDHHSPTTSRHWATEQCMSAKLFRSMDSRIEGCIIERNPLWWVSSMTEPTAKGVNQMIRGFRIGALMAAGVFAFLSTTALASDSPVRVLTTAFPNLPESIAIDLSGTTYLSFPFAGEVAKFAPGGSLSTVATVPGIPLGVRLDAEGNVFIAVIQINPEMGKGVSEVPASGGSAFQVASGVAVWNGMALDHRGNLYVSDTAGGAILRLANNGDFTVSSRRSLFKRTTAPGP